MCCKFRRVYNCSVNRSTRKNETTILKEDLLFEISLNSIFISRRSRQILYYVYFALENIFSCFFYFYLVGWLDSWCI